MSRIRPGSTRVVFEEFDKLKLKAKEQDKEIDNRIRPVKRKVRHPYT